MGYAVLRNLERTVHEYCHPVLLASCLCWLIWWGDEWICIPSWNWWGRRGAKTDIYRIGLCNVDQWQISFILL